MKYIDEFRDPAQAAALVEKIRREAGDAPMRLMEVCQIKSRMKLRL